MKNRLLCAVILLLPWWLMAQDSEVYEAVENPAEFLNRLQKAAAEVQTLSCHFTQEKTLSFMNDKLVSTGQLFLKGSNQMRWAFESPYDYVLIMNGSKLITIDDGTAQQNDMSKNPAFKRIQELMTHFLKGQFQEELDEFDLTIAQSDAHLRVTLIPQDGALSEFISEMKLYFNQSNWLLDLFVMEEHGDQTRTQFDRYQLNNDLEDDLFSSN